MKLPVNKSDKLTEIPQPPMPLLPPGTTRPAPSATAIAWGLAMRYSVSQKSATKWDIHQPMPDIWLQREINDLKAWLFEIRGFPLPLECISWWYLQAVLTDQWPVWYKSLTEQMIFTHGDIDVLVWTRTSHAGVPLGRPVGRGMQVSPYGFSWIRCCVVCTT